MNLIIQNPNKKLNYCITKSVQKFLLYMLKLFIRNGF